MIKKFKLWWDSLFKYKLSKEMLCSKYNNHRTMIFYHGTSKENWDAIQKEGILYGRRYITDNNGNIIKEVNRCTYLATDLEEAKCYGDVILQVEYDPFKHKKKNNYIDGCWQVRVYEPIPISKIQEIKL